MNAIVMGAIFDETTHSSTLQRVPQPDAHPREVPHHGPSRQHRLERVSGAAVRSVIHLRQPTRRAAERRRVPRGGGTVTDPAEAVHPGRRSPSLPASTQVAAVYVRGEGAGVWAPRHRLRRAATASLGRPRRAVIAKCATAGSSMPTTPPRSARRIAPMMEVRLMVGQDVEE